jgi:hypothetical protein
MFRESNIMLKAGLIGIAWLLLYCGQAKAYVLVEDVPNYAQSAVNEAKKLRTVPLADFQSINADHQSCDANSEPDHRAEAVR